MPDPGELEGSRERHCRAGDRDRALARFSQQRRVAGEWDSRRVAASTAKVSIGRRDGGPVGTLWGFGEQMFCPEAARVRLGACLDVADGSGRIAAKTGWLRFSGWGEGLAANRFLGGWKNARGRSFFAGASGLFVNRND